MTRHFLFLMMGFPGSGKSFVSEWLAPHMRAVHLRSDDMRLKMFGGEEQVEHHRDWRYQQQVHGAMQYAGRQVLLAGHSLIYDANHTARKHRKPMRAIADETGAIPILVWVTAPLELAKQRVVDREAKGGIKVFDLAFVDRMAQNLEPPAPYELFIELDGTQTAAEQQHSFDKQLAALAGNKVQ